MVKLLECLAAPLGRLLLSAIFLMSGVNKVFNWSQTSERMTQEGMVAVPLFLVLAIIFELGGGLLLLLGLKARLGAVALIAFLIPVTLIFHDFWQYEGQAQMQQMIHFMKNSAIIGGLCIVLAYGAGPISCDARSKRHDKD